MRVLGLAAVLVLTAVAAGAEGKGSCVDCHQKLNGHLVAAHNFSDWTKSAHARAGVSCESCHGGDAAAKDVAAAHRDVLRASDPASRIYFTRIPQTCGSCHDAELKAFRQSAHYKELETSGKGPNCVTCHGSMANVVLGPRELEHTCALCHRQPTQAFAARVGLDSADEMVRRAAAALKKARAAGAEDLASQEKSYREITELQRATAVRWHTFKMTDVLAGDADVRRRVTALLGELKHKTPASKSR